MIYDYEGIRRIPKQDPPGIPDIRCHTCERWTSEETIVWADNHTGAEGREGDENVFPFCQGCCVGDLPADEYAAHLIGLELDNREIATIMTHKWGHKTPEYLVGIVRDRIGKPGRRDLKEILMNLGNGLMDKGFWPVKDGSHGRRAAAHQTTAAILDLTEFMNLSKDAREILDSIGLDWSMPPEEDGIRASLLVRTNCAAKNIADFLVDGSVPYHLEPYPDDHWRITISRVNLGRVMTYVKEVAIEDLVEVAC